MQIAFAIELVIGVIFIVVFGGEELKRELSRRSRQRLLDPDDDDEKVGARTQPSSVRDV